MDSYVFDIGERARKISRFVGRVRLELQRALTAEKRARKLSQQTIATMIGVNRSVINRQLMGTENLTIRRVAELAWAMGWEIDFKLRKAGDSKKQMMPALTSAAGSIATAVKPELIIMAAEQVNNRPKVITSQTFGAQSTLNDNHAFVEVAA